MKERAYLFTLSSGDEYIPVWERPKAPPRRRPYDVLERFESVLERGGISISAPIYIGGVLSFGLAVFVVGLQLGPLFAVCVATTCVYELLVSHPKECIARQNLRTSEEVGGALEVLSELARTGIPLEKALVRVAARMSTGRFTVELRSIVSSLEHGTSVDAALRTLASRLPVPEVRAFVSACAMFYSGVDRSGDALATLARHVKERRQIARSIIGKVDLVRQLLLVASCALGLGALAYCFSMTTSLPTREVFGLGGEVGGIVAILFFVKGLRLTSWQAWEVSTDV